MASKKNRTKTGTQSKGSEKHITIQEGEKETLAFKIITAEQTQILTDCSDVDELQRTMAEMLELTDHHVDSKTGATLDYFVSGVWWAKEHGFSAEQTSAFFTVLHTLLDNIKEKHLSTLDNLSQFKKMFAGVAIEHCELSGGLECFDLKQATLISNYVHVSLFQHYQMYEFIFGDSPVEEIIGTDLVIEVPLPADMPWPPPLVEAVPQEIYMSFIATPPPSPEPVKEESEVMKSEEELQAEGEEIADLLSQLTTEQIAEAMNGAFEEMLVGLKSDVANKLRSKENDFINRINKIHRVASAKK